MLDILLAANGIAACEAKIAMLPSVNELVDLVEKFKQAVPKDVGKAYAEFYEKLNDENVTVGAKLKMAKIAKFYIYLFCNSFCDFFNYSLKLIQNEEIANQYKT
jgi:hypothetical protein